MDSGPMSKRDIEWWAASRFLRKGNERGGSRRVLATERKRSLESPGRLDGEAP